MFGNTKEAMILLTATDCKSFVIIIRNAEYTREFSRGKYSTLKELVVFLKYPRLEISRIAVV